MGPDMYDVPPFSPEEPPNWPKVVMSLISAFVILGLCAGCVLAVWILKP